MENAEYGEKTDAELVELTLNDQNLFGILMERYEKPLMRYIRRISNSSQEESEDILQEVFIKIYSHLREYDSKLKFSSWAYRITHNEVISTFRKNKARPHGNSIDVEDRVIQQLTADVQIEHDADNAILKEHIQEILAQMDVKYRDVLVLKYLEDKSYDEISDILKKPKGTVGTLINRSKKQFTKLWKTRT